MAPVGTSQSRNVGVVAALAAGETYDQVAATFNISKRTLVRKMAEPAFRAEVAEARGRLLDEALSVLAGEATATVRVLLQLRDGADSDGTKLAACRTILEKLMNGQEYRDLMERVIALEERLHL